MNASIFSGISPAEIASTASSVSMCLSKGLGAPVGSILAGSDDFITEARRVRKLVGGGMRQSGVLAACGLIALEDISIDKLYEDHQNAKLMASYLKEFEDISLLYDIDSITNIVYFELNDNKSDGNTPICPWVLYDAMQKSNIHIGQPMGRIFRCVTHRDVNHEDVVRFAQVLRDVLAS